MPNILSIATSALAAAQAGLATTGHNIANQKTPGYSRQLVIQSALEGQNLGGGYIGSGTTVDTVRRVYNEFISKQVVAAQGTASQLQSYANQIGKINNMLADPSSGLTPVIQDFFKGIQDLVSNPGSAPSRQAMLSGAESLAARFQTMNGQLNAVREGVNTEITASVTNINAYAQQISQLNNAISKAQNSDGQPPNDLLDQRDYLVGELAKEAKVTVNKQGSGYSVFIGNGQPLVVGSSGYELTTVASSTDLGRLQVGYIANGATVTLPEAAITGGKLGGLFEFRNDSLDPIQNSLGRIALGIAETFNAQHRLGQDQNGNLGGDFFNSAKPAVNPDIKNTGAGVVGATISSVDKLTTSDYRVSYDGSNYSVTRLSDNVSMFTGPTLSTTIDGVDFSATGQMATGNQFIVRPTANGAAYFNVLIKDLSSIAAATPIVTAATSTNKGSGAISAGSINSNFNAATVPVTLTYAGGNLTGFPGPVNVTTNGTTTPYASGVAVPYTAGSTISFGGVEIKLSGTPADGDTFKISPNVNGQGDNRNMLALGELQTKNVLQGETASYNSAYSQLVSLVGNKTREMQVNSASEGGLLKQMQTMQQSESGVNLDEEAANLIQYQQAYQAAAKVMQAVSDMFDILASLGR